jgi:dTDP-glucose 4,6-dehydratase
MSTRHLITGGLGFTGQVLTKALLERGEAVTIFDFAEPQEPLPTGALFMLGDIRERKHLARIGLRAGDVVHHLAARQFHAEVPKRGRDEWFAEVNAGGTANMLEAMLAAGAGPLTYFSTDMVYGRPDRTPVPSTHPRRPLGPYGRSKSAAEDLIAAARSRGLSATVFRPRLIIGPNRLGILSKLFRLIAAGLPVPLIGSGTNRYQMVSVFDCVAAVLRAIDLGSPPGPFNLGSSTPPTVRELLSGLIRKVGSRSVLMPTPAKLVKWQLALLDRVGLTLLYPEQFLIADIDYQLDTSETATALGWHPAHTDQTMIAQAYHAFAHARR